MKHMQFLKANIVAIAALGIAVTTLAFIAPKPSADTYVFQYTGDYTENSVEDLENWQYIGKNLSGCDNTPDQACRIFISRSDVDSLSPTQLELNSGVSITENGSQPNIHVSSISGTGAASYSNKSN